MFVSGLRSIFWFFIEIRAAATAVVVVEEEEVVVEEVVVQCKPR